MTTREERLAARHEILDAVNRARQRMSLQVRVGLKPYSMRSIQRAVCAARRSRLVKPETLTAAGFNLGKAVR